MVLDSGNRLNVKEKSKAERLARILEEGGERPNDDALGCSRERHESID